MKTHIIYVGLIDEHGNEPKGKGYKRQKITKWKLDWLNECFIVNEEISFPKAIKRGGVIVEACFFSAARGGRKIRNVNLTKKKFITALDIPRFVKGDMEWAVKGKHE